MENKSAQYKYCIVPGCKSTTVRTSNKHFFTLPKEPKRRLKWLKACRRDKKDISQKSIGLYVCEDHFDLEQDMDNYIKFKIMGGPKIIKSGVVPHIFDCQPDRKRAFSQPVREAALKRVKRQLLEDAASTSKSVLEDNDDKRQCDPSFTNLVQSGPELNQSALPQKLNNASTQTHIKIRSKGIQCKFQRSVTVGLSPLKIHNKDAGTSPIKDLQIFEDTKSESGSSVFEEYSEYSGSDDCWYNESDSLSCDEDTKEEEAKQFKSLSLKCTVMKLQYRPRLYMGLPEYAFYTFQLMEKYCKTQTMHLFLTLKKIRTGQTFMSLGDDFGISESNASRIFAKSVPLLSKYLRSCIFNPQVSSVKLNLPLAFRARYSKVFCIIDCLEIEIEKPSDSVKQSLTWSEYKKCNTLKYLIACTPDGIINFISTAFGGRTSDAVILEHSGFLNVLPPKVAVMADRGFKHIEHLLVSRDCQLIRPPSVSSSTKLTKSEVFETKRVASLRIHIERVIRRLREFACLAPHACIDSKLISHTDNITKIVCALINLQSGVISGK